MNSLTLDFQTLTNFSTLVSGYHKPHACREVIPKTMFRMRYDHYEFVVLLFELTNALAVFQGPDESLYKQNIDKLMITFIW